MPTEIDWIRRTDPFVERYSAITNTLSILDAVLPRDLSVHRERFVLAWESGTAQAPRFDYASREPNGVLALTDFIADVSTYDDPWHRLLHQEAEAHLCLYLDCTRRDPGTLTKATGRENGMPGADLLADALELLNRPQPSALAPDRTIDHQAVARVIAALLRAEKLEGWAVEIRQNMAASLSVHAPSRQVRVRAGTRLSVDGLIRLAVHEVGTHVFRWHNAKRGADLLALQLSGHTKTEEGLAVWHERRALPHAQIDRRFALRVVAAHAALTGGFTDVVAALSPFTDIRSAFDTAARAKRGLVDTSAPGAFLKDHAYLAGLREIEHYLSENPDDYEALLSCKWPLRKLSLIKQAGLPWGEQRPLLVADSAFVDRIWDEIHREIGYSDAIASE